MSEIMNHKHPQWEKFLVNLEGTKGCDFREDENGKVTWKCKGGMDKTFAKNILSEIPNIDIDGSLKFFEENGGHCDCEILFNVANNF